MNYYYLTTVLPQLQLGFPPDIDFTEFNTLLRENLTVNDYKKTIWIRRFYDILNIRALWTGEPLDHWGNLDQNQLEEALISRDTDLFPSYVFDFLDEHETLDQRLKFFPLLINKYYEIEAKRSTGFLHKFFVFERKLRLTLTAYRARQLNRDLNAEFQFEDPEEDIIAQLLAQKDAKQFEPPPEFEDLKPILEENYTKPLELALALAEYRIKKIEEMLGMDIFSIDRILGYLLQYHMVDKWMHFDKKKGLEIADNIVKGVS